jgi:hypothetical protein
MCITDNQWLFSLKKPTAKTQRSPRNNLRHNKEQFSLVNNHTVHYPKEVARHPGKTVLNAMPGYTSFILAPIFPKQRFNLRSFAFFAPLR